MEKKKEMKFFKKKMGRKGKEINQRNKSKQEMHKKCNLRGKKKKIWKACF